MESKRESVSKFEKLILDHFPTVKTYCDERMHGASGFYLSPDIFGKDFITCATNRDQYERFAAGLAFQLFCVHQKLLAEEALTKSDPFNVLECGGGNGVLCYQIFQTIEKMAVKDTKWKALQNALHYHLVELSPALVEQQQKTNKEYIKSGKVTVTEGSALELPKLLKGVNISVALSNELIDMFQPNVVKTTEDGTLNITHVLPFISEKELKKIKHVNKKAIEKLKLQSTIFKKTLLHHLQGAMVLEKLRDALMSPDHHILLTEEAFKDLSRLIPREQYQSQFTFHEVEWVQAAAVSEVDAFIRRNPEFYERIRPGQAYFIEQDIYTYLQGVTEKLIPGGEIITIDYGDNDDATVHVFKTFKDNKPEGSNIYKPGDITHNPNMTIIAEEGIKLGLHCLYYGHQDTLPVDAFPEDVLSTQAKITYNLTREAEINNFRVTVLTKDTSKKAPAVDRFTGTSQPPVTYAELAALPPLYEIDKSGQFKINLIEQDLEFINRHEFLIRLEMHSLAESSHLGNDKFSQEDIELYNHRQKMLTTLEQIKKGKPLSNTEKNELIKLIEFSPYRLGQYPTTTDAQQLVQKWKEQNSDKTKCAAFIRSPITATGDAHNTLVAAITVMTEMHKKAYESFLTTLNTKQYSKALRIICTVQTTTKEAADLAFNVASALLKAKESLGFDINETAGKKGFSALHHAANNQNTRLYGLLATQYHANVNVVDASGKKPTQYLEASSALKLG